MTEGRSYSDDRITRRPDGLQLIMRKESWEILYSFGNRNIYIIPMDYHPEPLQLSLREVRAIRRFMKSDAETGKPMKRRKKK